MQQVKAIIRIVEKEFLGQVEFVHALPGDIGLVRGRKHRDGAYNVTWTRTGTTTICFAREVVLMPARGARRKPICKRLSK
jgi:hypothetical protein